MVSWMGMPGGSTVHGAAAGNPWLGGGDENGGGRRGGSGVGVNSGSARAGEPPERGQAQPLPPAPEFGTNQKALLFSRFLSFGKTCFFVYLFEFYFIFIFAFPPPAIVRFLREKLRL